MAQRDIIVIGASLGGSEALTRLVATLPPDLPASVLIVQHIYSGAPSLLAQRLAQVTPLRTSPAIDGEPLEHQRIYVAVPDQHLMIESGRVRLSRGPKESHARPSVDVLFRSAAYSAGRRVIGIVLTGRLDDGTAGLWAIKDRGGVAIVQAPTEAACPSMPCSALRHVEIDYTLEIADMANILRSLTTEEIQTQEPAMNSRLEIETRIALGNPATDYGVRGLGTPSFYTCPDCHGSMVAIHEGPIRRFRCHTGHGYTERALSEHSFVNIEQALWSTLAQMEEAEALLRELGTRSEAASDVPVDPRADSLRLLSGRLRQIVRDEIFTSARNTESGGYQASTQPGRDDDQSRGS